MERKRLLFLKLFLFLCIFIAGNTVQAQSAMSACSEAKAIYIPYPADNSTDWTSGYWELLPIDWGTSPVGIDFVHAVSEEVVWATGYDAGATNAPMNKVAVTTDGGQTWNVSEVIGGNTYAVGNVCGLDAETAFVTINNPNGAQDMTCGLYKTTDGGQTWVQIPGILQGSGTGVFANNVWFWNENNGFCHGDVNADGRFLIYSTFDGGDTWNELLTLPTAATGETGGWTGVISTSGSSVAFGTNAGNIYLSHDMGLTWTVHATGLNNVSEIALSPWDTYLAYETVSGTTTARISTDAGQTWSDLSATGAPEHGAAITAVPSVENKWVSTGSETSPAGISYSTDNGQNWTDFGKEDPDLGIYYMYFDVDFVNEDIGYAGHLDGIWKWNYLQTVTFNVDMNYADGFDPAADEIYISSDILAWPEPGTDPDALMTDEDGDMVYTVSFEVEPGTYAYKYFKNTGWDGGEWGGNPNREIVVTDANVNIIDIWAEIDPAYTVTFDVDNGTEPVSGAEIAINDVTFVTGENGMAPVNLLDGTYPFIITKDGFEEYSGSAEVNGADITLPITLMQITYDVTFTVTDGSNPLEGADVDLDGTVQTTDAAGQTVFTGIAPGSYDYTVSLDGYTDATGTVSVVDANVEESIVLDEATVETATITFIINDMSASHTGFFLKGSWDTDGNYDSGWNGGEEQATFYDDGTNGDETAGDHVWTTIVQLVPDGGSNTWEWGFNDAEHNWVDGNFEFTVPDATAQTLSHDIAASISNLSAHGISLYPNPASHAIHIENAENATIKVYNLLGEVVRSVSHASANQTIDISQLAAGTYAVLLETNGKIVVTKINIAR